MHLLFTIKIIRELKIILHSLEWVSLLLYINIFELKTKNDKKIS